MPILTLLLASALVALAPAPSPAPTTPDDPDPTRILEQASQAVKDAGWIEFDYEYLGTHGGLGRVTGHAVLTPAPGFASFRIHADVALELPPPSLTRFPPRTVLVAEGERVFRIDPENHRVDTSARKNGMSLLRPLGTIVPPQFLRAEPFNVEIDQPVSKRWAGRALVDGAPCDVIYLEFSEGSGLGEQYFYLGVEDRLIRRLVFNSPGGPSGAPFAFELTLRNVTSGAGEPIRPIAPALPTGPDWTVVDYDERPAGVGDPAPDWELPTPDGRTVSSSDLAGQVVVLDFWASWCPFCRRNLPTLHQMTEDMRTRDDVRVLAVQMWDETDPVAFLESEGVELDVLVGGDAVAERLLIAGTPTAIVIGKDGTILHRETGTGEARDERLRSVVEEALVGR